MAEVFGVVASGIAVVQLTGSAIGAGLKLKELWDQVDGSHETIQDLIEHVECLSFVLEDAEKMFSHPTMPATAWNDTGAQSCAKYCRKALQSLTEAVENLAAQIHSAKRIHKTIGKLKVVVKKKHLDQLESKLKRAVWMLQMAQVGYIAAQSRLLPDILADKVQSTIVAQGLLTSAGPDEHVSLVEDDETTEDTVNSSQLELQGKDHNALTPEVRFQAKRQPDKIIKKYSVAINPPLWLASWIYAWRLTLRQSYSGWDVSIRYCARRPYPGVTLLAALDGDLELLKTLLATGQAHPHDEFGPNCETLLHLAVERRKNSGMIKFLLDAGSRADHVSRFGQTPGDLYFYIASHCWSGTKEIENFNQLKAAGLFPDIREFDDDSEIVHRCTCPSVIDASNFRTIQVVACPSHSKATAFSKLRRVRMYIRNETYMSSVQVIKQMLSPEWETERGMLCNNGQGLRWGGLLGITADILGEIHFESVLNISDGREFQRVSHRGPKWHHFISDWTAFVLDITPYCQDLHHVTTIRTWAPGTSASSCRVTGTPLMRALSYCFAQTYWKHETLLEILDRWLSVLKQAGVDLCEYGDRENALLSEHGGDIVHYSSRVSRRKLLSSETGLVTRLLRFKIGPDAGDWDLYYIDHLHDYASDFWALVEGRPVGNEPLSVPGAWVEED